MPRFARRRASRCEQFFRFNTVGHAPPRKRRGIPRWISVRLVRFGGRNGRRPMDGESYRSDGSLFTRFLSSRQRLKWLVRSRNARFPFRGAAGWLVKIPRPFQEFPRFFDRGGRGKSGRGGGRRVGDVTRVETKGRLERERATRVDKIARRKPLSVGRRVRSEDV